MNATGSTLGSDSTTDEAHDTEADNTEADNTEADNSAVHNTAPSPRRWTRALVTGGSSGIGRAMAVQLAAAGTAVVVVARDRDRLTELAESIRADHGVDCEVMVCDLADRAALALVEARIEAAEDPIDLLVNNAGLGFGGPFTDLDRDDATFVVDVNVVALQRLTQTAAATFSNRGTGSILNVGSLAGDAVGANSATYNATKAFVTSLGQSVAAELAGSGVTITTLLPGFTRTEFQTRSGTDVSDVPRLLWQSAEAVAAAGLAGAAAGSIEVVPSKRYRAFRAINRILPCRLKRRAAMNVARRSS